MIAKKFIQFSEYLIKLKATLDHTKRELDGAGDSEESDDEFDFNLQRNRRCSTMLQATNKSPPSKSPKQSRPLSIINSPLTTEVSVSKDTREQLSSSPPAALDVQVRRKDSMNNTLI